MEMIPLRYSLFGNGGGWIGLHQAYVCDLGENDPVLGLSPGCWGTSRAPGTEALRLWANVRVTTLSMPCVLLTISALCDALEAAPPPPDDWAFCTILLNSIRARRMTKPNRPMAITSWKNSTENVKQRSKLTHTQTHKMKRCYYMKAARDKIWHE